MSDTPTLGELLRNIRKQKRWSQKDFLDGLEEAGHRVAQGTLSAWENDTFQPEPEKWENIAHVLGIASAALQASIRESTRQARAQSMQSAPAAEQDWNLVDEAQNYALRWFGNNFEVWIVGPRAIPVATDQRVKELWAENLSRGIAYNILWFPDTAESSQVADVVRALVDVHEILKRKECVASGGCIHHWVVPYRALESGDWSSGWNIGAAAALVQAVIEGIREYDKIREFNKVYVCTPKLLNKEKWDDLRKPLARITLHWMAGLSLVCYVPTVENLPIDPIANVKLPPLRHTLTTKESAPEPRLRWLADEDAREIARELRAIRRVFEPTSLTREQP